MKKPENVDPLAEEILERLRRNPASAEIILGGYFGLQHYVDYRRTHDIDAWWRSQATPEAEQAIRSVIQQIASEHGAEYKERRSGATISFEMKERDGRRMAFQISVRDVALDTPQASPWSPILIETLRDNLGSKMNALVDRGAPRDFTDVHVVVQAGLATPEQCWELWSRKNPKQQITAAKMKALMNLERIEQRRPVWEISDPTERERVQAVRRWFRREFMHLPDIEQQREERGLEPSQD